MSEAVVSNSSVNRTVEKVVVNSALIGVTYFLVLRPILKKFGLIEDKKAEAERKRLEAEERARAEALKKSIKPDTTLVTSDLNYGMFKAFMDKKVFAKYNNVRIRSKGSSAGPVIKALNEGDVAGYFYSVVEEKLGSKANTWVMLTSTPNGKVLGYVLFSDIVKVDFS